MGVVVPFSGGEGREVFDWRFRLRSIPVCILLRETPSVWVVEHLSPHGFNGLCLLKLYRVPRASCPGGRSWGPLGLWAHQFSSDCFGLVLTTARGWCRKISQGLVSSGVQGNVWRHRRWGSPHAGSLLSTWGRLPELHPCMALAECMLLRGIPVQTWLCVRYIKGKCSAMNSSIHFITLIWFRFSITHMEWTSEFSHD